jgi:thiol-disulfide isomerase/thioredoxin
MFLAIFFIRLALSVVFGIAGFTKLLDLRGTREAITNFGAPKRLAPTLSLLLPICELAVAIALLFNNTARPAAIAAVFVLTVFVAVIGINLGRGRNPDCHCFGQLYSRPIGWPTLVRNLLFAIGGCLTIWQTGSDTLQGPLSRVESLLTAGGFILVAALAASAVHWRQKRTHAESAKGLPVDSSAPELELDDYEGGRGSLEQFLKRGKPVLLIFTSPFCGPCVSLFEEIGRWQQAYSEEITVAVISRGTIKENFVSTARNGLQNVLLQKESEVADLFRAKVTPSALVIRRDGTIGSLLSAGTEEIRKLMGSALGRPGIAEDPNAPSSSSDAALPLDHLPSKQVRSAE